MTDYSHVADRAFRMGAAYDLVVFDRLPVEEQAMLSDLCTDGDFYGVLKPRPGSGRTYRAIGKDSALLLLTLREPGRLPFFVWGGDDGSAARTVTDLVLDGVLEIENDGGFISGPAAAALFDVNKGGAPEGRLAQLSRDALLYGQALQLDDPDRLAARLYNYGRCPVSPAWARVISADEATLAWLGAPRGTSIRRTLDQEWQAMTDSGSTGWLAWRNRGLHRQTTSSGVYKLYVSPRLSDIGKTFSIVIDRLGRQAGVHFKIGRNADGLMRPDKMVAYFDSLERLLETANDLSSSLNGVLADGVPFTAELTSDGLLSWGMDPPAAHRLLGWQGPDSWRLWVVRRLAAAMVAARVSDEVSMPPWRFAVERLNREGIDTERWIPSATIWSAA